jgi:hypothetical protein
MIACQEATEAYPEKTETNSEEMQSGLKHWNVPKEHATVKPDRGWRKRHRGQCLAVGHCIQPKKWAKGNGGFWKKLATDQRRMTRRTRVVWH